MEQKIYFKKGPFLIHQRAMCDETSVCVISFYSVSVELAAVPRSRVNEELRRCDVEP